MKKGAWHASVILLFIAAVDLSVRFTPIALEHWHYVLHRLYYLAIVAAGLRFGWAGGLITALLSGASYLVQNVGDSPDARNPLDRFLETAIFCLVGLLAGTLAERERVQRERTERARSELELLHTELRRNIEDVKRADRMSALGHLSAGLAHEIRNPLAAIEGSAALIHAEPERQEQRQEFLEIILKESRRLGRLVTDFLDFAKPRAPELRPVPVQDLIDSVVMLVSQTVARSMVDIEIKLADDLPAIQCDAEQIKQVLLNLLLNAVQAMPEGGTVIVTATEESGLIAIRIQDNGPGIKPSDVDSIYDPFFMTRTNGTGLGLAVAYQIVQQDGGDLLLEQNSASGARFAMLLPATGAG